MMSPPNSPRNPAIYGHGIGHEPNFHSVHSEPLSLPTQVEQVTKEAAAAVIPILDTATSKHPAAHEYNLLKPQLDQLINEAGITMGQTDTARKEAIEKIRPKIEAAKKQLLAAQENVDQSMKADIETRKWRQFVALCIVAIIIIVVWAILKNTPADHPNAEAILWGIRGGIAGGLLLTWGGYKLSVYSLNKRLQPLEKLKEAHVKAFKAFVENKQILNIMGKDWWKTPS